MVLVGTSFTFSLGAGSTEHVLVDVREDHVVKAKFSSTETPYDVDILGTTQEPDASTINTATATSSVPGGAKSFYDTNTHSLATQDVTIAALVEFTNNSANAAEITVSISKNSFDSPESDQSLISRGESFVGTGYQDGKHITQSGPSSIDNLSVESWRHIDMVEKGADPTGNNSVVPLIQQYAANDTLLYFPPGTYLIGSGVSVPGMTNFGLVGNGATFVPGTTSPLFGLGGAASPGENIVFKGFTFDFTATSTGPQFFSSKVTDGLYVDDITVNGQADGGHQSDLMTIGSTTAHGMVEVSNIRIPDGSAIGSNTPGGQSMGGIYVFSDNLGQVRIRDCHIEGCMNNGIYGSDSQGKVIVEGGLFKNNDISNVRLGGGGVGGMGVLRDARIINDNITGAYSGARGIWLYNGYCKVQNTYVEITSGTPTAIEVNGPVEDFQVEDTHVHTTVSNVAWYVTSPSGSQEGGQFSNCRISGTGSSATNTYIVQANRPDVSYSNCYVKQVSSDTNNYRAGLQITGARNTVNGGQWYTDYYNIRANGADHPIVQNTRCIAQVGSASSDLVITSGVTTPIVTNNQYSAGLSNSATGGNVSNNFT